MRSTKKKGQSNIQLMWVLFLLFFNVSAIAQETVAVSGTVITEKGEVLPAVTVIATRRADNGRQTLSAVTNEKGIFTFPQLRLGEVYDFTFSSIGYETHVHKGFTVKQPGNSNTLLIRMKSKSKDLGEVVVTALGIKKSQRSLGYALTKVDSNQLTDAASLNWMDALSGKVAGLNLVRSGSGPAATSKIILRGENNLTGNNEALIIIDGVVVSSGSGRRSANGSDQVYATNSDNLPADYGSAVNDINPQDIESVSVLLGPAAAALYGQRAANGAVIITTKSATQKKGGHFNVRYTVNGSIEQVNRFPDLQYEYGQGLGGALYYSYGATEDGASTSGTSSAYGPKFDGQSFYQYDPVRQTVGLQRTPWKAYDNINDFWDMGRDLRNNLSIDGKIGSTGVRITLGSENNKWIVPNTGFVRQNIGLSTNTDITKKLKLAVKANYGFRKSDNLPAAGYGNQSLMYWYIFWQPSADHNWLKNYWAGGPGSVYDSLYKFIRYPFSSFPENPYAITNEFLNKTRRNNLTGNVTLNYQVTKELSVMLRGNYDWMNDKREQDRPFDAGTRLPRGSVRRQNIYSREKSYDIMAKYFKELNPDWKLGVTFGGSQLKNEYDKTDIRNDGLHLPGIYTMENTEYGLVYFPDTSRYQLNSLYGIVNLSYKNFLFAELTGRQDWSSILASPKRKNPVGFSYPSINTGFVLSDVVKLPELINYLKLRASYAMVGSSDTYAYTTAYSYPVASGGIYPDSALVSPTILPNPNLKPLLTTTYEFGTEIQFFNGRIALDLSAYFGNTRRQIFTRTVDASSGYSAARINAGKVRNNGIEISLNAKPVVGKKGGFNWNLFGTFSYNQNKILSMPDSAILLRAGQVASGQIVASVGGSMGDLYGLGYMRSPDGQVIFDPATGFPRITDSIIYLGNTTPKFKFSLGNKFQFRNFTLSMLFDAQIGAVAYSLTHYKLAEQGKLKSTLPGRYNGIIGNGVIQNPDGSYRKNDVVATDIDQYYQYSIGSYNAEGSTFSTDFLKFREASLMYNFKPGFLKKFGLSSASVGVFGRDLFIWSPWPIFDPEFGTLSGTDVVRGFEVGQFPSSRTMGFNLTIGF
ncbi:SusC/RagA family TonB-linked outer membrane protein [Pseudobacter ginsenosidimutans]|uniref:TonB-linked SusC/RagA family outer membrane protein n=1 Tax=Pseudobacter ginsenosidimutans TaxID=661488 RepID=A0A4Q7N4N3_9BACT|nr:SusC/RagA family TonB-linked outer membrane protein [Pseudobacter ginsenosidimutans]QEC44478.1 SusC/RagA family TonB-linked outer membrane protein [Pseudobacter ginsenosidimutans]RZS75950.1 TonB-linked SusC/RagA family outer membrane protein [Pseudobacter ginsenosidimutans]